MGGHLTIEEKNAWKESVLESRLDDFIILKDWLKAEKYNNYLKNYNNGTV